MDIASRFQARPRPQPSYLDREGMTMLEDSGNESESLVRRKFQRTVNESNTNDDTTFRKPSLPASASRPSIDQSRPSFTHNRRRSTLRENTRVPSGPREFPSPSKRVTSGSFTSFTPSVTESHVNSRSFLPQSTSEPYFNRFSNPPRFSSGNPSSNDDDSPTTPAERTGEDFDFIPTVNFDDLHNSIANYDPGNPLLSDFPAVGGRRALAHETSSTMAKESIAWSSRPLMPRMDGRGETGLGRASSFRRRLTAVTGGKQDPSQVMVKDGSSTSEQQGHLSLRTRRQTTAPQGPPPSGSVPSPAESGSKAPRKSLGPGVIASMMDGRKANQPAPTLASDQTLKAGMGRTNSLTKASRRTTIHPPASSAAAELPRISTATATTQSRANKVKSLQAPPREQDPGTPSARSVSKSNHNRAQTPSSSGNKRQSTVSGRASGLGARTISPTDARRLKRLSMMQAPPLPSKNVPPTPQEEMPPFKLELPRLAQPSPSFIPRRASGATPSSARASPDGRQGSTGGVSLSAKSSYQSLLPSSSSTSRLPAPKSRNVHSSSDQHGEENEIVPPVPAIPKAYESPRECELPFFSGPPKSSQSASAHDEITTFDFDSDMSLLSNFPRTYADQPTEQRRKQSMDHSRTHQRMSTIDMIEQSVNIPTAKQPRQLPDATGRKNSNLQPLRLPPLNLMPVSQRNAGNNSGYPLQGPEPEDRENLASAQTPEPKRNTKTPSTPMTASKATFFRRQDEQKNLRSSTSHFALRDLIDDPPTQYFEEIEANLMNVGVPIPSNKQRGAITPFSSGSLPKASGEFVRARGRPSGDYNDDHTMSNFETFQAQASKSQGPRASRSGTNASLKTMDTQSSFGSPAIENEQAEHKKGGSTGGLRRKLSLGWRRTSSKASNHPDHKSSPQQENSLPEKEHTKLQKRASQMPPPKLPTSATWTGDVPSVPPQTTRPSFDSIRRKSTAVAAAPVSTINANLDSEQAEAPIKTKSVRSDQPQPVSTTNRASSWGNLLANSRELNLKPSSQSAKDRQNSPGPLFSALVKDKDDVAADEEMRRLSQKRRDVDTAAKETEELKKRAVARSSVSPERVLHDRNCTLNIFERGEIMDYEKDGIFFTGAKSARKIIGSLTPSPQPGEKDGKAGNYGYDDERGDYNIVLGDHLAYRYEVVDVLGKGSFGQVVRCVDHKEGGVVAVKIIRNKKRFHQQALVEVGILGRLRDWDPDSAHATLSITSSFYFRSHLCIVTPCLSINLYELIRAHNFVGFSLPLIRRFARQLLSCLVLLQKKRIIHCDLKPENILLCEARKADVRVIDFGSSCKEEEKVYTYIQSRFYRSPEVILGSSYGLGIDMWSFGCILAELWTGYPLFPGENEQEQLACIMEIFGPPDRHIVERCTRKKLFFDSVGKPRVTVSSKGRRRRPSSKTLSQALKSEDEAFLDFITRCLRWDPDRRLKPHDAVSHAFITNQSLNQRPGIPDEARRAARLRSTAAVPATNGNIPSPIKRVHTTSGVVANSGSTIVQQQTPAKERVRPLPETPQTAVRTGPSTNTNPHINQGSPSKQFAPQRRQSSAVTANAAAIAGSKRASNGVPLSSTTSSGLTVGPRQSSNNSTASLAQLAAREASAARWRT